VSGAKAGDGKGDGQLSRLPPGRHGLPREFVIQNQRERLVAGAIAAVSEKGYRETTVTDIAAAASMSRRTFYGYFSTKEECFFDTYTVLEEFLVEAMAEAGASETAWPRQVRARIEALLESFAANPDLVRFSLLAPPAAGGEFADRHRAFLGRLVDGLIDGLPDSRGYKPATPVAKQTMAGALSSMLTAKVDAGEGEALEKILPKVLELVLAPFIGRKRAMAEAKKG
jgi:AcrR family transcriptional regulator